VPPMAILVLPLQLVSCLVSGDGFSSGPGIWGGKLAFKAVAEGGQRHKERAAATPSTVMRLRILFRKRFLVAILTPNDLSGKTSVRFSKESSPSGQTVSTIKA